MAIFNKVLCQTPGCNYWRTSPVLIQKNPNGTESEITGCPKCSGKVKTSSKYTIQWYEEGGSKRTKTFGTEKEALAILSKIESEKRNRKLAISMGIDLPKQSLANQMKSNKGVEPDGSTPFELVANEFRALHAVQIKDVERERIAIDHLIHFFDQMPIGEILQKDLMAYQAHRQDQTVLEGKVQLTKNGKPYNRKKKPRKVCAATVTRELTVMRMIIKFARKNNYLSIKQILNDPFEGLKMAEARTIVHIITQEERERLFSFLTPEAGSFFEFIYESGCRISEVMTLKWSRVEKMKTLAGLKDTKSQKAEGGVETLFLSPMAWEIINAQPRVGEYVFNNPRTGTRWKSMNASFRRAAIKAGLVFDGEPLRPHDLRHNFLTEVADTEIGESTLMMISRHKDAKSLRRYLHRREKKATDSAFAKLAEKRQMENVPEKA